MPVPHSPLRYPGGKSCLFPLITKLLKLNNMQRFQYAEPYAGGAGLALALMYSAQVSDIHINDVDPAIWSFWHSVLNRTDELISYIANTPITVDEWRKQRKILIEGNHNDPLNLGFATFFLNRTNRSGIIKDAGVIGGVDQTGKYKMDCRFNREGLINRIKRIAKYKGRIHLTKLDALEFIERANDKLPSHTFLCVDPPYFNKGSKLYTSFYDPADHAQLAECILRMEKPWIVTYDNTPEITALYRSRRQYEFDINYSIETKRKGTEILIASKGLRVLPELKNRQSNFPKKQAA